MTNASSSAAPTYGPLVKAIGLLLVVFVIATLLGVNRSAGAEHEAGEAAQIAQMVPAGYAVLPFVGLLLAIAILPLTPGAAHWWEHNQNKFLVAAGLAGATLVYYAAIAPGGGAAKAGHVLVEAVLVDYVPFITLLLSLYTICGGIRVTGDLQATPAINAAFMMIGSVLASFIGTTGAAMLLIRPLLETNRERKHVSHTVVFFIFAVCNCGGCLLPIGDPPLFLGYLRRVPFWWTMTHLWQPWLVACGLLVVTYYVWDRFFCYPAEAAADRRRDVREQRPLRLEGIWPNAVLLLGVVSAVAVLDPTQTIPVCKMHWPIYAREAVLLLFVAISLTVGKAEVRRENGFNFGAILEVAALFSGIFVCMHPALEILRASGGRIGMLAIDTPWRFFWASGSLSSVLDNAPTYAVFFDAARGQFGEHQEAFPELAAGALAGADANMERLAAAKLAGVSLGSVFLGAMTYIGNGPNFMVRTITEQSGVKMPSFFGYIFRYSVPVLLPIFFLVAWLFLSS